MSSKVNSLAFYCTHRGYDMQDKPEECQARVPCDDPGLCQSKYALIDDDGNRIPPLILWGIAACALLSLLAWWFHSHPGSDQYESRVRDAVWTTYAVGNPHTYALANMRASLVDPTVVCGRINYERTNNLGWSGYSDFYLMGGVVYIAPIGGRYEKEFSTLCIATPDTPQFDKPAEGGVPVK